MTPWETATVQPGVVHYFFSVSDRIVQFPGEAGPGQPWFERFAQIAYGLATAVRQRRSVLRSIAAVARRGSARCR